MNLLILNSVGPDHNPRYRGTYRENPTYCEGLPAEHEVNRLFFWFVGDEGGGEYAVVHDLQKALRYAELYNACCPGQHFEVVEAVEGPSRPNAGKTLLGFDIAGGFCMSLLDGELKEGPGALKLPGPILELSRLINTHFAPQLNANRLFDDFDVASACRRSMIALQSFSPSLYEGGDLAEFVVVGLYLVQ